VEVAGLIATGHHLLFPQLLVQVEVGLGLVLMVMGFLEAQALVAISHPALVAQVILQPLPLLRAITGVMVHLRVLAEVEAGQEA
jgi:hypothetical protein